MKHCLQAFSLAFAFCFLASTVFAQGPPPPPGGNGVTGKIFADDPATGPNEGIEIKIVNSNTGSISIKVPFEVTNPTPHGVEPYIQITYEEDQGGNNGFQPISGVTPWTAGIDVGAGTTTSPTVKGFTPTLFEVNPLLISSNTYRATVRLSYDNWTNTIVTTKITFTK